MKKWKMISGIVSIVLGIVLAFQAYQARDIVSEVLETYDSSNMVYVFVAIVFAGGFVSIVLLLGGIISLVKRDGGIGSNIVLIVMNLAAVAFAMFCASLFRYLSFYAAWCLVCLVMAIVSIVKGKKSN